MIKNALKKVNISLVSVTFGHFGAVKNPKGWAFEAKIEKSRI